MKVSSRSLHRNLIFFFFANISACHQKSFPETSRRAFNGLGREGNIFKDALMMDFEAASVWRATPVMSRRTRDFDHAPMVFAR